jgi:competence protein ComEC
MTRASVGSLPSPASEAEDGNRDLRMLPVALMVWATMLLVHELFNRFCAEINSSGTAFHSQLRNVGSDAVHAPSMPLMAGLLVVTLVVVMLACRTQLVGGWQQVRMLIRWSWLVVMACSALVAAVATVSTEYTSIRDPAMTAIQQGRSNVRAVVRLTAPVTASNSWQAECQTNVVIVSLERQNITMPSHARATLFATGTVCRSVDVGQTVRVRGALEPARYGIVPIWLTAVKDSAATVVSQASLYRRMVALTQRSFFSVTERLSDQGRVLVPGLTIGLLGQDVVGRGQDGREPVNTTFAKLLEMHFKNSGIIHLMAVSGGHFALVAGLIKRCCSLVRMPRQAVAMLTISAYFGLASLMYPSDSVVRALVMGVLASLAIISGRRPQAASSLSWTVIVVLIFNPSMARSFGFALSCAAVLGIVLCAKRLEEWLNAFMPRKLAEATSTTLAAEAFTMPVQVLMTPQLPVLALPANLIVAPFVDWSTLMGLAALLLAPLGQWVAYPFAWLSSQGTEIMRWCADTIGALPVADVPWAGGPAGAMLTVMVEVLVVMAARLMVAAIRRVFKDEPELEGERFISTLWQRMSTWITETEQMFEGG